MSDQPISTGHGNRIMRGFLALLASSATVMALQLIYAASTSRLLSPAAFGAYAVASAAVALLSMVSGSSLGLSAARREHESSDLDRSLLTLAVVISLVSTGIGIAFAGLWEDLWAIPGSAGVTRVLLLSVPAVAVGEVLAGVLRRAGRTTAVAWRTAIAQVAAMGVGLVAVLLTRADWSLAVSAVVAAFLSVGLLLSAVPQDRRRLHRPSSEVVLDVTYAVKAAGMNLLRYATYTLPAWSIGRFTGAAALGAYNRATSLLVTPLEAVQRSLTYSLFPELRPGGPVFNRREPFTDITVTASWVAIVAGGIGYFAAPPFLLLLLGPGWELAAALGGLAALLGVVPIVAGLLGAALEALARFRVTWFGWLVTTGVIVMGVVMTVRTSSAFPAVLGLLIAKSCTIPLYGLALHRSGHLDLRRLWRGVIWIILGQTVVCAALFATSEILGSTSPEMLAVVVVAASLEALVLFLIRDRTPLSRLADVMRGSVRTGS